jgi:hypothetical protein
MNERNKTNLNATAAGLGPNHIPTSFPANAMRCTPNGAVGASRNQDSKRAWRACAGRERGGKDGVRVRRRGGSVGERHVSKEV